MQKVAGDILASPELFRYSGSIMNVHYKFDSYVQSFLDPAVTDNKTSNDTESNAAADPDYRRNILLKKDHSERVRREIVDLCRELVLNQSELYIAEFLGLYHDIGRFEQYRRYGTFRDDVSEDHASLGVRIIREESFADHLTSRDRNLVLTAIELHNKARLPGELPKDQLFFSRLLRDADKLDIWKVVTDYYEGPESGRNSAIELDLPDTPTVSKEVYHALLEKRVVNFHHMHSLNDFKLLQIGWVFDLNFPPTLRKVAERGYIEKIMTVLPDLPEIRRIYDLIRSHILEPHHAL